jgi:vacuolar-type H+-ATPase subunit I/STV1
MWKGIYDQHVLDFPQEIDKIAEKFNKLESWTQCVDSRLFITEAYLKIGSRLKLMKETHEQIRVTQAERARDLTDASFGLDLGDLLPMPMLDLLDGEFWQQVL